MKSVLHILGMVSVLLALSGVIYGQPNTTTISVEGNLEVKDDPSTTGVGDIEGAVFVRGNVIVSDIFDYSNYYPTSPKNSIVLGPSANLDLGAENSIYLLGNSSANVTQVKNSILV